MNLWSVSLVYICAHPPPSQEPLSYFQPGLMHKHKHCSSLAFYKEKINKKYERSFADRRVCLRFPPALFQAFSQVDVWFPLSSLSVDLGAV